MSDLHGIVHWDTEGINRVACGAGARWSDPALLRDPDRAHVTCLSCQRTKAFVRDIEDVRIERIERVT